MIESRTAIVFGATGLVGRQCLDLLLSSSAYSRVTVFVRRSTELRHPKLVERVVDFGKVDSFREEVRGDDLYYCLGTTIAKAGSRAAFRSIDFELPAEIAKSAMKNGVSRWLMVTSIGASESSPSFYLRVKGELEQKIAGLSFKSAHFFRPSLLLGKRSEVRLLEGLSMPVARALSPLLFGSLRKYRPVDAREVAAKMIEEALTGKAGTNVHTFE